MKELSNLSNRKEQYLTQNIISRRELLKKGVAASAIISLLPFSGAEDVFAAERENSSKSKDPYKDVNFSEDITSDIIRSCIHPASHYPNGCSQCGNALQSSWINSLSTIMDFLDDAYKAKITASDLSQVVVTNSRAIQCGGHVAGDEANIVKDENGKIQGDQSSGYCSAPVSEFANIPIYRVQWIIYDYLKCVYDDLDDDDHNATMWLAWIMAGKPDYS